MVGALLDFAGGVVSRSASPFFTELVKLSAKDFSASGASAEDEDCIEAPLDLCHCWVSRGERLSNDIRVNVLKVRSHLY